MKNELLNEEETYRIRGVCFEVYKEKGCGFLEAVYRECLELELASRDVPFAAQPEPAAVSKLADEHRAQVIDYLNAAGLRVGLLVNFGHPPKAEIERMVV